MSNLTTEVVLEGLAQALRDKVLPALIDNPYAAEQLRLVTVLLSLTAKQVDSLAAVRAAENSAMRTLFAAAAPLTDSNLAARLAKAACDPEPGLKISELDGEGARLRLLLVELHAALAEQDDADASAMHQRIWRLLRDMEERRA